MYWDWGFFGVLKRLPSVIRFIPKTSNHPSHQKVIFLAARRLYGESTKKKTFTHAQETPRSFSIPHWNRQKKEHVGKVWWFSFHTLIASVDDFTHFSVISSYLLVKPTKAQHKSLTKGRVSSPPYTKTLSHLKPSVKSLEPLNHFLQNSGFLKFLVWNFRWCYFKLGG